MQSKIKYRQYMLFIGMFCLFFVSLNLIRLNVNTYKNEPLNADTYKQDLFIIQKKIYEFILNNEKKTIDVNYYCIELKENPYIGKELLGDFTCSDKKSKKRKITIRISDIKKEKNIVTLECKVWSGFSSAVIYRYTIKIVSGDIFFVDKSIIATS